MSDLSTVTLGRINLYPIKSLPGLHVSAARILPVGSLENDRRWALIDESGKIINAKRYGRLQQIRCEFAEDLSSVSMSDLIGDGTSDSFVIPDDLGRLGAWFSDLLGQYVRIAENPEGGFPDDSEAHGPTIISHETLLKLSEWFPQVTIESLRLRFRANLELDTPAPFWEDQLYGPPGEPREFQIGDIRLLGVNPCQRCVVPSRDPQTAEPYPQFQKLFAQRRRESLPTGIATEHFNHYYRLAVNTRLASGQTDGVLCEGDSVRMSKPF
ncbi:MOSC domain-containing protein [Rubinisphaera margarita]|uniref:MOSC domain-containing protein n=1 Tax=Rubinisphaera margarita TaxID=2909586 RepID=UPI001EE96EC8|nr:MOSC N-terminal beta barrel domain-containing protein [Rubinisphaera margarita]MCG6158351.1 MOSC N-terminal beta barrel domain-containing protein [Rubinisphaera margarita]